jgi:hypothetical protein
MAADEVDVSKLPPAAARQVDFTKDIKPMLEKSCFNCHGASRRPKGKYRMNTREELIKGGSSEEMSVIVGSSEKSPMIHFSADLIEEYEMPPLDNREKYKPLTKDQIGLLRAWIDQGAKWPEGVELVAIEVEE